MSRKLEFVWGPGGVGKSHMAIREAAREAKSSLLLTLDPSPRIFDLLGLERRLGIQSATGEAYHFDIKATDAVELFEKLQEKAPANETVKWYFHELVNGLQGFRDYLSLIELAADLEKANYDQIVVDTPPFHEALGLHKSILTLREFFEKSLVQFTLRHSFLNMGIRKVIEVTRLFVGAKAVEKSIEFLDWLSLHLDRFQKAARSLESVVFAPETVHHIILTPESPIRYIREMKAFFRQTENIHFTLNRSAPQEELPSGDCDFLKEMRALQHWQFQLEEEIRKEFPKASLQRLPLELMGEDTAEELHAFIRLEAF